jgi:3-oxoacyl-[acyl-carrier-protein] synthase II
MQASVKVGYDGTRFGVVMGSGIGGITTFQEEVRDFYAGDGTPRFNVFFIPKMIIDIASGHVSMKYGLKGPNYSCVSACATSTNCIADAFLLIRSGMADIMLAGGSEAAVTEAGVGGFNAMKALSTRNDSPSTASRPFDIDRDGFVLGEGGGAMVLEEYEHAKARGARIYAELRGVGLTADAYHLTAPHPEGEGAAGVMTQCLQIAGLNPQDVDYINVHGTSTPLGDIAETMAIKRVFGAHATQLNISSTKSMTGHLLGAAGVIEAIASVLSIHHGVVPPTINHFTDDPACDLNYTFNTAVKRDVRVALSNTFGFGGHNASVVFSKVD